MGIGIDIGSKTIKIVELQKQGNLWALAASGVVAYSGNPVDKIEDEKELAQIAQIVKKLYSDAKISKRNVVASVPEPYVFNRVIRFPLLTDQEIASAVKWEAEQYIPIPIAEAVVQHLVIERDEKTTPPQVSVLLVAVPIALVEKYVRLLQLAGLTVDAVETEMLALSRSVAPDNQTSVLLDFGSKSTDIAIVKNKNLYFSKSTSVAGDALTRALAQNLQVEEMQAEEYKKNYGMAKNTLEGKIEQILSPILLTLVDEVKKAIHFYQTEEKGEMPKSMIISGGGSGLIEVVPFFTKQLGIEVIIGNPFNGIKIDSQVAKTIANYSPLYSIAVGLAEKGS